MVSSEICEEKLRKPIYRQYRKAANNPLRSFNFPCEIDLYVSQLYLSSCFVVWLVMQVVPVPTPQVPRPLTDVERMQIEVENLKKNLNLVDSGRLSKDVYDNMLRSVRTISEIVQFISSADDFYKIGGFDLLSKLLAISDERIRAATAELVADLVQNNAFCQTKLLETEVAKDIMNLLKSDEDTTVCVKALYALSCLCRNNHQVVQLLEELNALPILMEIIKKPVERLRIKVAFFLSSVVKEHTVQEWLYNAGFVEKLIELVKEEQSPSHEHLLSILVTMVECHEKSKKVCCEDSSLDSVLKEKILFYEGKEEHQESLEYATRLVKLCS